MKRYLPLIVLVALSALLPLAVGVDDGRGWLMDFMGYFLVNFTMLKLFDLPGFAKGFARYDLLAQRWKGWGFIYPFLELALGFSSLGRWNPDVTQIAMIALMGFGAIGVFTALKKGLNIDCACMGTSLKVPLSTVAIVEDLGMVILAALLLIS
ncbi:MAG: hypothetical protein QNK61_09715 [Akkermansiaceae bacterium]